MEKREGSRRFIECQILGGVGGIRTAIFHFHGMVFLRKMEKYISMFLMKASRKKGAGHIHVQHLVN